MKNNLLTSNFLITLIKAIKKNKIVVQNDGTDIESIYPVSDDVILSAKPISYFMPIFIALLHF